MPVACVNITIFIYRSVVCVSPNIFLSISPFLSTLLVCSFIKHNTENERDSCCCHNSKLVYHPCAHHLILSIRPEMRVHAHLVLPTRHHIVLCMSPAVSLPNQYALCSSSSSQIEYHPCSLSLLTITPTLPCGRAHAHTPHHTHHDWVRSRSEEHTHVYLRLYLHCLT